MQNKIESFGLTHVGMKRSHNEDAIFLSDPLGLYLVADGMGGHSHGEVASSLAIETISQAIGRSNPMSNRTRDLEDAIRQSNERIRRYFIDESTQTEDHPSLPGMGTTLVALTIYQDNAIVAHIGDSRLYRLRGRELEQLTQDHSLAAMAAAGQDVPTISNPARFKNVITRALGIEATVQADLREEVLYPGDLFLLCSDGLTNMVDEKRISKVLTEQPSLSAACQTLIDEANANGGRDNISCVLVKYA